jgi:hypothetical protein
MVEFDCWDRKHSDYDPDPIDTEPPSYEIARYSLNEQLLNDTPLSERLLFKMGGTTAGKIIVHQSIMKLFQVKGADLVLLEEWW